MADDSVYCGTWKITKCMSLAGGTEATGIEGTEFTLDESGDVWWKLSENTEPMPFFDCETYEVFLGNPHYLRFFGNFASHLIEFRVDQLRDDAIQLVYESWCILQCEKLASSDDKHDLPFSFLCALEEGYFSDLVIVANNGKEFKVHKTILKLGNPSIDWNQSPCPLDNLPEDTLYAALHFLYCECLPVNMKEETAQNCLQSVVHLPGFAPFVEMCEIFLKNSALKQQIMCLVQDMHGCASRIIDYFSGKIACHEAPCLAGSKKSVPPSPVEGENLATNPAKLCYVMKQALREGAIAGVKLLILCDIFSRRKNELSREERHEIIKYCKSRLPIFMNQLHKLLDVIKSSFGNLSASERVEIAAYLVPEIETTLESISHFIRETKTALEQIIDTSNSVSMKGGSHSSERGRRGNVVEALSRSLRSALHKKELRKLRSFHEKVTMSCMNLLHKKENFGEMTSSNKIRSVAKNMEQITDEIPMFILRIEELRSALDEKLSWKEWKYLFKRGTSKVAWVLSKVLDHRVTLRSIITHVCEMVGREQFTRAVVQLGLLEVPPEQQSPRLSSAAGSSQSPARTATHMQSSMVDSLCQPPQASRSKLAKNAVQLLKCCEDTDMKFEIVTLQDATDTVIDHTRGQPLDKSTTEHDVESYNIEAHRVIIASRCDWFRRALLSGMRESIDKKIVVHDSSPLLFRSFLEYLYGGHLDSSQLTTEQLADLMQLSDRYEVDSLKHITEQALKSHIDEDSALFLLSIADQFNARSLRNAALEFISFNKDIIKSEVFYDLPEDLQSEVEEMITWVELRNTQRSEVEISCPQYFGPDSPSSMSSSLLDIEELTSAMNLSGRGDEAVSDSSSLEELPLTQDSAQLEACVAQLRDIVGETVSREELVRISLAADYDVNRALNFFFS